MKPPAAIAAAIADTALFVSARLRMALCALFAVWLVKVVAFGLPGLQPAGETSAARAPIPAAATAGAP